MKRRFGLLLGGTFWCLLTGTGAYAVTLTTPPLSVGADGSAQCELVNVGSMPVDVTVLPVRLTPGPIFDPLACVGVGPRERCVVQIPARLDVFCQFIIPGSKRAVQVRAVIATLSAQGTTLAALPAN
jgi:hypothetical protein